MKTRKLLLWVPLVLVAIIILAYLLLVKVAVAPKSDKNTGSNQNPISSRELISSANFLCDGGKSITASFYNTSSTPVVVPGQPPTPNGSVDLYFSDGRTMTLNQTISADGGRYANGNESIVFWNRGDTAFVQENGTTTFSNCAVGNNQSAAPTPPALSTIANPASVNCQQKGGQLNIAEKPDGSQYGLCYFGDNMACEEWAMFRGDCPVGGVKTTGYVTDAQKFCAWSGGQTSTASNAVCTFKDGSTCPNDAFYAGTCQPGTKTN